MIIVQERFLQCLHWRDVLLFCPLSEYPIVIRGGLTAGIPGGTNKAWAEFENGEAGEP
jgi:hypothetical protein